jgi:MSHA biogenesis protein MshM
MYREFFGLRERPFGITPDTSYFFAFTSYQEALNTLLVAVRTGEGFIKITGEVGTGKTLLCRKFLASLGGNYVTAYIPNPYLEPRTLLMAVAEDLRIPVDGTVDQHHLLKTLTLGLLNYARHGKRVVLCLDEAQAMPLETMEALRLLTNLETEKRKLLQIVLFGQPELDDKLDHVSVRQLKQRISFHYRLGELGCAELEAYVAHRLAIAGYAGERLFTRKAMRLLYRASGGVPRLVNILAHKAMLLAYGQGRMLVEAPHVRAAVADTPAARRLGWWWMLSSLGIRG